MEEREKVMRTTIRIRQKTRGRLYLAKMRTRSQSYSDLIELLLDRYERSVING